MMVREESAKMMLQHLIVLINESMQGVKPASLTRDMFEQGRALAYYEVGEFVLESARLFNVSLEELGTQDFNPDLLL